MSITATGGVFMNITISGDIGSGKSTIGRILADKLHYNFIDGGQLYRKYAAEKGRDVLEQNKSGDISVDKLIDDEIVKIGAKSDNTIFVSRTAWYLLPDTYHIYLSVSPKLAAKRVLERKSNNEKHTSIDDVVQYSKSRTEHEDARYTSMYGFTRTDQLHKHNLVCHIGSRDIDEVVNFLLSMIPIKPWNVFAFDPRSALPTQVIRDMNMETLHHYMNIISGDYLLENVAIHYFNSTPYIYDGHHRVAAACLNNVKFMMTTCLSFPIMKDYEQPMSVYYDWEDLCKIKLSDALP